MTTLHASPVIPRPRRRSARGGTGTPAESPARLTVEGARVALGGAPVLRGADVAIDDGQVLALLGPSGCGKTTLLRAIAGLQRLDEGTVRIDGHDLQRTAAEERGIGLVFQHGALFPHLDVGANVGFGLRRGERDGLAVHEALEMVGLGGLERRAVATLSGGQQQRVALARSLVTRPRVLLLDEPFASLDASLRDQLRRDVTDLLRSLGTTTVVVTHDQEEAFALGDQVAVMFDGVVHQQAPPVELYEHPADRRTASFLGDVNLIPGTADGDVARTPVGTVPLHVPAHGPVDVVVRPEHLRLVTGTQGTVEHVEYHGHDAVARVDVAATTGLGQLLVRFLGAGMHRPGASVDVYYDGPTAVAFPAASA